MKELDGGLIKKLSKLNILTEFPKEVREGLKGARVAYFSMQDVFREALLEVPYFDEVFAYNSKHKDIFTCSTENAARIEKLSGEKRAMVANIIENMIAAGAHYNPMPPFPHSETPKKIKKKHPNVNNKKSGKSGKKRGGTKKWKKKKDSEDNNQESQETKEVEEEDEKKVHWIGGEPKEGEEKCERTIVKIRGKYYSMRKRNTPEEILQPDHGLNKKYLDMLAVKMEGIVSAVLDILEIDFVKTKDNIYKGLAQIFGDLASPIEKNDKNLEKMSAIVSMVKEMTCPRRDYQHYDNSECERIREKRERKEMVEFNDTIPELIKARKEELAKETGRQVEDIDEDEIETDVELREILSWGKHFEIMLEEEEKKRRENGDENVKEEEEEEGECTCKAHAPCPCCCPGCYPINHKDLIEQYGKEVKIIKKGVGPRPSPEEFNAQFNVQQTIVTTDTAATIEELGPKIEEISDELVEPQAVCDVDDEVESVPKVPSESSDDDDSESASCSSNVSDVDKEQGVSIAFEIDKEDINFKDTCSHCCCDCSLNKRLIGMVVPEDYEEFATVFRDELERFSYSNSTFLFQCASVIGNPEKDLMLRQKVVEIALPTCLRLLKEMEIGYKLYIVQLVFKIVMSMDIARKYCFRDPDYFPTLAKLLGVVDKCRNRDPNQLRGDAAHVLYVSLMGCNREVFEKVAQTDAFDRLVDLLDIKPKNERDAQSAEDAFSCFELFTDEWDLFLESYQKHPMNKLIDRWRMYALEYTSDLPNFIWMIETLKKRMLVVYQAAKVNKRSFRLQKTFDPERLQEHARHGCSNSTCYKTNFVEYGEGKYKKCSKCNLAYYCSRDCQLAHWKKHKRNCVKPKWVAVEDKLRKNSETETAIETSKVESASDPKQPRETEEKAFPLQQLLGH